MDEHYDKVAGPSEDVSAARPQGATGGGAGAGATGEGPALGDPAGPGALEVTGPFAVPPGAGAFPAGAGPAEPAPLAPAPTPAWESPMPLSMPPFARSAPEAAVDDAGAGGQPPGGGLPPVPPWHGGETGGYGAPPPSPPGAQARHGRRMFAVAAAAALLAGGLGAGLGVAFSGTASTTPASTKVPVIPSPTKSTQASTRPTESIAAIAKAVGPAIVDINTNVASPASQGQQQAAGTGMIITSSGEVLTNNHVVEQATKITVSIQGHPGTYQASVIGVDPSKDVALLQIEGYSGSLPTVTLGDSSTIAVGDSVVAIGNALGIGQQPTTVTGIVSALGRTITASDQSSTTLSETLHGLIETDAPIQPGDSGGPLIDARGQVIGMDTAASSSADSGATLGFAIPINEARAIVQRIEKGQVTGGIILGESPFLGIYEVPASSSNGFGGFSFGSGTSSAGVSGVAVSDVAIGSPAQAAGIVAGDTITKVNSTATPSIAALRQVIDAHKVGDQVTVTYVDTSGVTHTATVTLAGLPK